MQCCVCSMPEERFMISLTTCLPNRQQSCTWPHLHTTRLQPPFFSTWLRHLGQGLVLVLSQFAVSLSSLHFRSHCVHLQPCSSLSTSWTISMHAATSELAFSSGYKNAFPVHGMQHHRELNRNLCWQKLYDQVHCTGRQQVWGSGSVTDVLSVCMTKQRCGLRFAELRCDCTLVAGCGLQDAEQEASHLAGAGSMGLMATLKAELLSTSAAWLTIQVTVNLQSSIWANLSTQMACRWPQRNNGTQIVSVSVQLSSCVMSNGIKYRDERCSYLYGTATVRYAGAPFDLLVVLNV